MTSAVSPINGAPVPTPTNLTGRPPGARSFITKKLIADYTAAFEKHGAKALEQVARVEPAKFLQLGFGILPRDVLINVVEQRRPGGLSTEDWEQMLRVLDLIKACVPAGVSSPPSEVFGVIENALRAHYARDVNEQRDASQGS